MATIPCPTCEKYGQNLYCPLCKGKGHVAFRLARSGNSKYGNEIVEAGGYTFDSRAEARRYGELKMLEDLGQIEDLLVHPSIPLHAPDLTAPGSKDAYDYKPVARYEPDFSYTDKSTGAHVLEDVKGAITDIYKLKRRWVKVEYGIDIVEVQA